MRLEVVVYFIWCKLDGDGAADVNTVHDRQEGSKLVVSEVTGIIHVITQPLQGTVTYL